VFSDALPAAAAYAELLATEGTLRGLIGPREVPRLWERHLVNCALVTDLVPPDATVCDIGSGAGLPGLVMAIRRPDLEVTLVEPLLRRTTFLEEAVARLGLTNVEVVRARAEALHGKRTFDVVTSRAVAPMERLAGWSLPLVRSGGLFLAMKGSSVTTELESAARAISAGRGKVDGVIELGEDLLDPPVRVVRIVKE
jgi:16S rRNA (guanine527-N7)-methyltransferase